jgi:hypothetical protein
VFPIFAGGDHMPASRFMVPAVPVIALVVYEGLVLTRVAETRVRVQALGALLLLACVAQWPFGMLNPVHADPAVFLGLRVGEYARSHFPAGSVVGINAAGAVPYVAKDLRFIDMLGLNDRHIAHRDTPHSDLPKAQIPGHRKGDGAYVLSRRPDFIILGPPEGTTVEVPWWVTDYEIRERRPMFEQLYRKEEVDLDVQTLPDHESFPVSATGTIHFVYYRLVEPVELRKQG